jgi:hypothetical protein
MERDINSDLGLLERAMETSKAYQNSNFVRKYDGSLDMNKAETLHHYVNKNDLQFAGISKDAKDSDELRRYIVIPMQISKNKDELGGNVTVLLILDPKGHDVGIQYEDETGKKFMLSDKIKANNDKILSAGNLDKVFTKEQLEEEFGIKSLEDVVDKVSKGKHIGLLNGKEVVDRMSGKQPEDKSDQEKDEEKALEEVPEEMRGTIAEICKKTGMNISDLKQTLTIRNPETLIDDIENNKTRVDKNGGEVIALRFRNKEAGTGPDEIILVQGENILPRDEKNNEILTNIMEQNKGNGIKVDNFEDNREEEFKEAVQKILDEAEEKKQILMSAGETENLEEELQKVDNVANEQIEDLVASMKPQSKEMEKVSEMAQADLEDNSSEGAASTGELEDDEVRTTWGDAEKRRMQNR